jgi:NAD(P)-dependent dehydrogenase (short-subunit alcohol dehydrogenase family)
VATVLIIGASRGIGLETVKAALKAGHSVRALARSARRIRVDHPKLEKMAGDAREMATVWRTIFGALKQDPLGRRVDSSAREESSMAKIGIVYFSGYGHTKKQAEAVIAGAEEVAGASAMSTEGAHRVKRSEALGRAVSQDAPITMTAGRL